MDGDLDKQAVIDAVNRKSQALGSCVAVIRTTDSVVGSLNVQVTSDGQQTKFELQSDVSDAAKKCVLSALEGVSVKGKGRAMVLLTLE
jgi:hypothetical protein